MDNFCIQGFGGYEVLSLSHDVRTNVLQCINDLVNNLILSQTFTPSKMHVCLFDPLNEVKQDMRPLDVALFKDEVWPLGMCLW